MKILKYWVPVFLMIGAMYYASTDVLSGNNTLRILRRAIGRLFPGADNDTVGDVNFIVRKTAHFVEYALLAALLFRAFRAGNPVRWRLRWAVYSFVTVACWSLLDEYHQSLSATRGGSVYDSMLDSAGGLCMLLLIALFNRPARK